MKKILLTIFLFSIIPLAFVSAGGTNCPTGGFVPCGTDGCPCEFCDLFVMINGIIKFVMFTAVPIVATLMLIIGGAMFLFAGAKPDILSKSTGIITAVVIGLVVIFAAWVIVNTVMTKIGIIESSSFLNWWKIGCPGQ